MYVFFSIIYSVFGAQAWVYHLFDLLLHILNTILLFVFLKKIFIMQKFRFPQSLAFLLSLIFLVHPVNVEAVAYIAVTQDLMLGCFLLLGLLLADYYCRKPSLITILLIHLSVLSCLLCKESGIIAVAIIPAFCYFVYRKLNKTIISFAVIPLAVYTLMRLAWDRVALGAIHSTNLVIGLITFPYELASYIRLIFFPKDLYLFQEDKISRISDPRFYLSLLVVIVVIAVMVWLYFRYKSKILTFFLLWIVLSFLVLSNIIVSLGVTVAERWMYVPLIGLLGFSGLVITRLIKRKKTLLFLSLLMIVFIPLAMVRTYVRIGDWYNINTLVENDLRYVKNDPAAYSLYAILFLMQGNDAKNAVSYLSQASKYPDNVESMQVRIHLGMALAKLGETAEATKQFYELMQDKNNIEEYDYITQAYINIAGPNPDEMINLLRKPIQLSPNDLFLNKILAIAYFRKGDWQSALFYVNKVYQLEPSAENLQSLNVVESNIINR
jgi:Tfp pilus assembly protein PilF